MGVMRLDRAAGRSHAVFQGAQNPGVQGNKKKRPQRWFSFTLFLVLCTGVAGLCSCAGEGESESRAGASFSQINTLIIQPRCALSGCHDSATRSANLDLSADSAYGNLVNVPSTFLPGILRVAPGDPEASLLVRAVRGTAGVIPRMPLNQAPLSDQDIDSIVQWIAAGAAP